MTPEARPLSLFGPAASAAIEKLLAEAASGSRRVRPAILEDGTLRLAGGEAIPADAVVALPGLEVRLSPACPRMPTASLRPTSSAVFPALGGRVRSR